ncbi:MAG: substrate-binding domain-containing protein [Treponema sp.]|nr:substrate-binding domain-containing protein [Treponema sp.]
MHAGKKKIGFVLASTHTGAGQSVWPSFVRTALVRDCSLYIFPGGRLNAKTDSENLRNSVYSLVNDKNLDGCISWSSTIRYTESNEEFEQFHSGFGSLPFVTMTHKVRGRPCVAFDAYTGIRWLVSHCIDVHGAKKIAFLRGPDFHKSAHARYEGYCDALREHGLPVTPDSLLVTDPFNWNDGQAAAAQLFEDRGLRPGRDFDTLAGSSDLMTLGAVNYFLGLGYHIPDDYRAIGFNNSVESRLTENPLSTVNVPYSALGKESFRILSDLMKNKNCCAADVFLPVEPIIRESCGCIGSHFASSLKSVQNLTAFILDYLKLDPADSGVQAIPVISALERISESANADVLSSPQAKEFFNLFEKVLPLFFASGRDIELLFGLTEDVCSLGLVASLLAPVLKPAVYRTIHKIHEKLMVQSRYETENRNTVLNSLKCELLGTRDRRSLIRSLALALPKIGIKTAGIALYRDDKTSFWAGSFLPDGISGIGELSFPAGRLVPQALESGFADGIFMVQPLFTDNQSLGYFIHNVPFYDGVIFEELRSAVSYALKGIFLFEELAREKRIAEQAERAKTEFISTLENELVDPLAGIMERIEKLQSEVSRGFTGGNADGPGLISGSNIDELKSYAASREERIENLLDLALSGIDDLPLKKSLFNPEDLFSEIAPVTARDVFPLIGGDSNKLSRCFSLIREIYSGDFTASVTYRGLRLVFMAAPAAAAAKTRKNSADSINKSMLLPERVILMHGGEFKKTALSCVITLPWPDLNGNDSVLRSPGRHENILSLSGFVCGGLPDLPVFTDPLKASGSGKTAFIIWNTDSACPQDLLTVSSLCGRSEFAEAAFLCFGKNFIGEESIISGIEKLLRSPKKTILYIGGDQDSLRGLSEDEIFIPSMSLYNDTVSAICPQMIICNSADTECIAAIRRHPMTVTVPVVITPGRMAGADVTVLSQYSRVIICHRGVSLSPEFISRLHNVLAGAEILPPHTGALVKKTISFLDRNLQSYISRWKLADAVNVNEDYLTRIFRQEMGLPLWDYLNRLRVYIAEELLLQTDLSVQEIAYKSGFRDHAYFNRVFKKIIGIPPGHLRKQITKSEKSN